MKTRPKIKLLETEEAKDLISRKTELVAAIAKLSSLDAEIEARQVASRSFETSAIDKDTSVDDIIAFSKVVKRNPHEEIDRLLEARDELERALDIKGLRDAALVAFELFQPKVASLLNAERAEDKALFMRANQRWLDPAKIVGDRIYGRTKMCLEFELLGYSFNLNVLEGNDGYSGIACGCERLLAAAARYDETGSLLRAESVNSEDRS